MNGRSKINSYFAMLIFVIAAAGAVWLILKATNSVYLRQAPTGTEASYSALQQKLLSQ